MATSLTGLDSYKLAGVKVTDRVLGRGAYATVLELEYMGLKCAGKKIHDLLLTQGNSAYAVQHFHEECCLLSRLHHPNIVQFLGVYPHENALVPILVMEYLPTNLTSLIEDYGVLPEEIGYPILHGVALGLCFLHHQIPPIIHRDLSSNNVLLNANLTAKISDLGVARILNMNPVQASRMTQIPGTPAYMPPEAMIANPNYNASVDVFSFGVMIIHVFCGQWPEAQGGQIRFEGEKMIAVSEAERRQIYLDIIGKDHSLIGLILQCISNNSQMRPQTSEIVEQLSGMVKMYSSDVSNQLDRFVRSRTDSVQEREKKSESETNDGLTGCIRRRPVYKVKLSPLKEQVPPKVPTLKRKQSTESTPPSVTKEVVDTPESDEVGVLPEATRTFKNAGVIRGLSQELESALSLKKVPSTGAVSPTPRPRTIQETTLEPQLSLPQSPIHPICVANYDYSARDDTELGFKKGELFVVKHNKEKWWLVRSMDTGKEGIIPSNYMNIPLDEVETDHSQIQLARKIANGRFSTVFEGLANRNFPVAVKVLKPGKMSAVGDFLKKATIIKVLSHPNVVHISASCTKMAPVYVAYEMMKHGNLLHYLHNDGRLLSQSQLTSMAAQIANGMTFLEGQGYIHRDIAARSVLVSENLVCKLANFHLAQYVSGEFYEASSDDKVAIKWTAPEAAKFNRFTIKSDVWSFGVFLFEVITYGRFPYPGMTNSQVMEQLQRGYRMPKPVECPYQLYAIMLDCWKEDARSRPTFQLLHQQLNGNVI